MSLLIDQHRDILRAIRAGDADAAAAAVRVHLREILLALPRLAKAFPDLFEDEELPSHAGDLQPALRGGGELRGQGVNHSRVVDRGAGAAVRRGGHLVSAYPAEQRR